MSRLEDCGIPGKRIASNRLVKSLKIDNYHFIQLDCQDFGKINELFKEQSFDHVIHLAAQAGVRYSIENPRAYLDSNIIGFFNVLELSRKYEIEHFIYASSSSVYGKHNSVPYKTNDKVDHPVSFYAATKKANELMAHTYSHLYGMVTTGLRFFTVYGPWGRPEMSYFLFTDAILKNQPINVFNEGKMTRDFTYIDDIVEGINLIVSNTNLEKQKEDAYRIYNIGNTHSIKLIQFIETIQDVIGKNTHLKMMPMQLGDMKDTLSDVSDLVMDYNYKPKVSLKEGLTAFYDWYQSFYKP